ncbi:MAG: hypothetical protein ACYTAF_04135, partial [Planctomycetota bacterium]
MTSALTTLELGDRVAAVAAARTEEGLIRVATVGLPEGFHEMSASAKGEALRTVLRNCALEDRR